MELTEVAWAAVTASLQARTSPWAYPAKGEKDQHGGRGSACGSGSSTVVEFHRGVLDSRRDLLRGCLAEGRVSGLDA